MDEADILAYLKEIRRVIDERTTVIATFFLLNGPVGRPFKMLHPLSGHCSIDDPADSLHAIGYTEEWLEPLPIMLDRVHRIQQRRGRCDIRSG